MRKLIIFGAGSFAEIAHYYFTHDSPYTVSAFTVDAAYLEESSFQGLPVVPFEKALEEFPPTEYELFVAMGIQEVNRQRAAKVAEAEAKGYRLASFISSRTGVSRDVEVGPNSMIMEYAGIQPFVRVGRNTIIWSATRIGFHSRIGDHCWLACPILGESVRVGDYSFIGINATIAPSTAIGQSNVIGAGAVILQDTKDHEVYRGAGSQPMEMRSDWLKRI